MKKMANRCAPEVQTRAVRMMFERQGSYETQAAAIVAISPKIGCSPSEPDCWKIKCPHSYQILLFRTLSSQKSVNHPLRLNLHPSKTLEHW
jgi:hypothetical protein